MKARLWNRLARAGAFGWLVCFGALAPSADRTAAAAGIDGPLSPEESLRSFQTEPGLKVELVAAEPVTGDPVAMAFDENGRLFIVENRGYPTGPGAGKPPAGVIAMLEDADGNGRYEKRTVFAEGLTFPNGLMPWKGGWIVTCAPDVLYLKDTNGDGRADLRKVLFTGFSTGGSTQLRVSHPTSAIDNWVYLTSGLTGGKITAPDFPERPAIDLKTDFRFRPDTADYEAAEGKAQYGMTFDDFGHRFICMNRMHVQHVVMPARYLRRNPALAVGEPVQNVPESLEPEPVRGHGQAARVFPISRNVTTADSHAGTFTSACGVMIYRGIGLPAEYDGNVFSCEPAGNLVHRDALIPKGASFAARRVREGIEFLASTDNWFRPVYVTVGPDGALYVCAMYRKTIDHPDYFPGELKKHLDFDSGKGMGRIYRVSSAGQKGPSFKPNSKPKSLAELCRELENPNGWSRDTAHRLLLEKQDKAAVPALVKLFEGSGKAEARTHALRLLEALRAISPDVLKRALQDRAPGVRENALQLAEANLKNPEPWLATALKRLAHDPDARVRFQCALTMGDWGSDEAVPAIADIAVLDAADRWARVAALSGIRTREESFFAEVLNRTPSAASEGFGQLMGDLGKIVGASMPPNKAAALVNKGLQASGRANVGWQLAVANGAHEGARAQGSEQSEEFLKGLALFTSGGNEDNGWLRRIRQLLLEATAPIAERVAAATFLGIIRDADAPSSFDQILDGNAPQELQVAAIRALGQFSNEDAARRLLRPERWKRFTPAVREAALSAVLSKPTMIPVLLEQFEQSRMPVSVLSAAQRKQLLEHKDSTIKERAGTLFQNGQTTDRMKVYADWKTVLRLKPSSIHGRAVFKQHCLACHRLDQEGVAVGPDLFGMRNQPKDVILLHVIVPEYEILPGFANYDVEMKDGSIESGMIASETSTSVVLRKALGEERVLARGNIISIASSGLSLMPQGLEANMSRQDMADLLAYLKGE
jgi:putative membrane-bound dehydrogenase-like protein